MTKIATTSLPLSPRRFAAAALFLLALVTSAALGQSLTPQQQIDAILEAVQTNRPDDAVTKLRALMPELNPRSVVHDWAALLDGQLTGSFVPRQKIWLDRKIVDTVVLVKDEASFAQAVAAWPADRFWPVLIDDGWYSVAFIDRFKPRHVVRWNAPKESLPAAANEADRQTLAVAAAIADHNRRWRTAQKPGVLAPGLVVIDPLSAQRCGGLALAIGRGEPILAMHAPGDVKARAPEPAVLEWNRRIMRTLAELKMLRHDQWCGITLAGEFPLKFDDANAKKIGPQCVDDRLGRDDRLIRRAATGRLWGSDAESTYMAMCSLFLQPRSALLINTYGWPGRLNPSQKSFYHQTWAAQRLSTRIQNVTLLENATATIGQFRSELDRGGWDWLWVNSSGGIDDWNCKGGTGLTQDVPVGRATLIHLTASFSATQPWSTQTIAGEALAGGAWWYFGSVQEPYLQAFVTPTAWVERIEHGTPLGLAARLLPGQMFSGPWKLVLIGDPLFALREKPAQRIDAATLPGAEPVKPDDSANVGQRLATALVMQDDAAAAKLAAEVLAHPDKSDTIEFTQAARLMERDRPDLLRNLPGRFASLHPSLGVILRRVARRDLESALAAKQFDWARDRIVRLIALGANTAELKQTLRAWSEAMKAAGREEDARSWLNAIGTTGGNAAAGAVKAVEKEMKAR